MQIFEPRYVDMISACTKSSTGFGVVLIRRGNEVRVDKDGEAPSIFDIGTYASIVDFNPLPNGRFGIITEGGLKFRVCQFSASFLIFLLFLLFRLFLLFLLFLLFPIIPVV